MKQFIRDASVHIAITFYDSSGAIVSPSGANVTLSYVPLGSGSDGFDSRDDFLEPTFVTFALTQSGTEWTFDWDSSIAEPGIVSGHAITTGGLASSVDFSFRLIANRANKLLAGDA